MRHLNTCHKSMWGGRCDCQPKKRPKSIKAWAAIEGGKHPYSHPILKVVGEPSITTLAIFAPGHSEKTIKLVMKRIPNWSKSRKLVPVRITFLK